MSKLSRRMKRLLAVVLVEVIVASNVFVSYANEKDDGIILQMTEQEVEEYAASKGQTAVLETTQKSDDNSQQKDAVVENAGGSTTDKTVAPVKEENTESTDDLAAKVPVELDIEKTEDADVTEATKAEAETETVAEETNETEVTEETKETETTEETKAVAEETKETETTAETKAVAEETKETETTAETETVAEETKETETTEETETVPEETKETETIAETEKVSDEDADDVVTDEVGVKMETSSVWTVKETANAFLMTNKTVEADESDESLNTLSTDEKVEKIFEIIDDYGVVANETTIKGDLESNIATEVLKMEGDHTIGSSGQYDEAGSTANYIGSIQNDGELKFHDATGEVVFGSDVTVVEKEDGYQYASYVDEEGNTHEFKVTHVDGNNVKSADKDNALDVEGKIQTIATLAAAIMDEETSENVKTDFSDMNRSYINTTESDLKIAYVDIKISSDQWGNTYYNDQQVQSGGLSVYKNDDQVCVINVSVSGENDVNLTEFYISNDDSVKGTSSAPGNVDTLGKETANEIVWNFGNYSGNIRIKSSIIGTIIAPFATLIVESTSTGTAVVNEFENPGGEWHSVSTPMPEETPGKTPDTTPSATPEKTPDTTPSATPEKTPDATPSATPVVTPSATPSATPTATPVATPSATPTATPSATPTATPSATPTATPSATPTATPSATPTATPSATPTATPSATATPTATPSATPTATPSATPTATPTATPSATPTATPSATPSVTPTTTPVATPSATPEETPGVEPTPEVTPEVTPTPGNNETPQPENTPGPDEGGETPTEPPTFQDYPENPDIPEGQVLGAKRVNGGGAVLGARRGSNFAVLGKRRRPSTGDSMAIIIWMIVLAAAAGGTVISLTMMYRNKKREN